MHLIPLPQPSSPPIRGLVPPISSTRHAARRVCVSEALRVKLLYSLGFGAQVVCVVDWKPRPNALLQATSGQNRGGLSRVQENTRMAKFNFSIVRGHNI